MDLTIDQFHDRTIQWHVHQEFGRPSLVGAFVYFSPLVVRGRSVIH